MDVEINVPSFGFMNGKDDALTESPIAAKSGARTAEAKVVGITPGLCRAIKACQGRGARQGGQMGGASEV